MHFHLVLHAVFSPEWCQRLIASVSAGGFAPASVNHYGVLKKMTAVRNNDRAAFDDAALAGEIDSALRQAAPTLFTDAVPGKQFAGIGSDFKVYKYVPGQYFKPHRDGNVTVGDATSLVTVLIYLNDADGGATVVMPDGYGTRDSWITVAPRTGDVLVFSHDLWHEGRPVTSGEKFVLRTDLLYNI
jgi:prolyl 4-hydroxylase